jgi:hypothetical protein
LDGAEELAADVQKEILHADDADWARGDVATAAARKGDRERVQRLTHHLAPNPFYYTLIEVVAEVAAAGDVRSAEELARSLTAPDRRRYPDYLPHSLVAVAEGAARGGDLTAAEAVANAIEGRYTQAKALTAVAREMARAGRASEARASQSSPRASPDPWAGPAGRIACCRTSPKH